MAGTVFAAHYDPNKPVTLTGTVRKVEWNKPYVKIHMGVTDTAAKTKDWEIETAAPNVVESKGLTSNSVKEGDQITVQGDAERNGSAHAFARSMTLADGQTIAINTAAPTPQVAQAGSSARATTGTALPRTATNWPLFGLLGFGALAAWAVLSMMRRLS